MMPWSSTSTVGIILYIISYWYPVRLVLGELVRYCCGLEKDSSSSTVPALCITVLIILSNAGMIGCHKKARCLWVLHGARTAFPSMPLESSARERMGNYGEGPLVIGTGIHSTVAW